MKKLINGHDVLLAESLLGFGAAHADLVRVNLDPRFIVRADAPRPGKVAVVSGGGSGHEPLHGGMVGTGMLDAACPGEVFTSPTPDQIIAAAQAVDGGAGTLLIVKNYSGDVMNFEMAAELMAGEVATVLVNDDVAVEDSLYTTGRRGVAGTVVVEKVVGAAAEAGRPLADCAALGERVNTASGSLGVALTSCTVPAAGTPTLQIAEDEIEFGVGIHGEAGRRREKLRPADAIVGDMVADVLADLAPARGTPAILLVNGFGATPLLELYLIYHTARRLLEDAGVPVARTLVGNYTTSLDMAGCSLTVTLADEEILSLWDAPVRTAALRWGM